MKNDHIMLLFLWISVEWEYIFMKDNISGRKEFIIFKIINSITFLTKRKTKKYATTSFLVKFICG